MMDRNEEFVKWWNRYSVPRGLSGAQEHGIGLSAFDAAWAGATENSDDELRRLRERVADLEARNSELVRTAEHGQKIVIAQQLMESFLSLLVNEWVHAFQTLAPDKFDEVERRIMRSIEAKAPEAFKAFGARLPKPWEN